MIFIKVIFFRHSWNYFIFKTMTLPNVRPIVLAHNYLKRRFIYIINRYSTNVFNYLTIMNPFGWYTKSHLIYFSLTWERLVRLVSARSDNYAIFSFNITKHWYFFLRLLLNKVNRKLNIAEICYTGLFDNWPLMRLLSILLDILRFLIGNIHLWLWLTKM